MGISAGPNIIRDSSLVLSLDASDANSFNKNEGRIWSDTSGNNTSGSIINGPSLNNDSLGSFSFNGINSYISIANNPILQPPISLTLECVLKVGNLNNSYIIAYSGDAIGSFVKYGFRMISGGLYGYINSSGSIAQIGGSVLSINTWTYATLTYDGSSAKIYRDGILEQNYSPFTGNMDYNAYGSPYYLNLGRNSSVGSSYISGSISIVKIYNKALSASEVQQNYNQYKTRFNRTTPNIITYTSLNTTTAIESFNDVLEFTNVLVGYPSFGAANAVALVNEL